MVPLSTAQFRFRKGWLLRVILTILLVTLLTTPKFHYDTYLSSPLTDLSFLHFNATAGMISNETSQSATSNGGIHNQTTQRRQRSKNRTRFPRRDHPHAGARDQYGNWGYVADHQIVRKRILEMYKRRSGKQDATFDDMIRFLPLVDVNETKKVCNTPPEMGIERNAWDMMVRKIEIGGPAPLPLDPTKHPREPSKGWESLDLSAPIPPFDPKLPPYRNKARPPKIGCFLYTHKKRHHQVWAAGQTWGWRCDGFLAFSNLANPSIGAVDLPHRGAEEYGNMWQKVRSIWAYIHDNYMDDFDYFHLAGDDTYVIVENLRNYLWSVDDEKGTKPLYIGSNLEFNPRVCGGGSGYILNKVTLRRIVKEVFPHFRVNEVSSMEDVFVGHGLQSIAKCYQTHDARGAIRFYYFGPEALATFDGMNEEWANFMYKKHAEQPTIKFFFNRSLIKEDLLSSQLITWHHILTPVDLKRVTAILYRSCPKGTILANALKKIDMNKTVS